MSKKGAEKNTWLYSKYKFAAQLNFSLHKELLYRKLQKIE